MKLQEGAKRSQKAAKRVSVLVTRISVQDISKGTERPVIEMSQTTLERKGTLSV